MRPASGTTRAARARTSSEHSRLTRRLETYDRLAAEAADLRELAELSRDDDDAATAGQVGEAVVTLRRELERLQEDALFNGEYDPGDAVVSIQAATGGTDAQDWAEMLLRMYLRWAADRAYKTDLRRGEPGRGGRIEVSHVHGER